MNFNPFQWRVGTILTAFVCAALLIAAAVEGSLNVPGVIIVCLGLWLFFARKDYSAHRDEQIWVSSSPAEREGMVRQAEIERIRREMQKHYMNAGMNEAQGKFEAAAINRGRAEECESRLRELGA